MLNNRQLTIIDILEHQNISGLALAKKINVSTRTIMRDIDYINFTLGSAAIIRSPLNSIGYTLDILEREAFYRALSKHDNDDRILLELLTQPYVTLSGFANILKLPATIVAEKVNQLRARYEKSLCISSKPNAGHYIDEPLLKKTLILANLIKKNPAEVCPLLKSTLESYRAMSAAAKRVQPHIDYHYKNGEYLASLLLAVYHMPRETTAGTTQDPYYSQIYAAADLPITYALVECATNVINILKQNQSRISPTTLQPLLHSLCLQHREGFVDNELINDLSQHISRYAAYPDYLPDYRNSSINHIKATYPVAFDLSIQLVSKIKEHFGVEIFDIDLIGLYFSCAIERQNRVEQKIILFSSQYAIANINRMAIEREIADTTVFIVNDVNELYALLNDTSPILIINNSQNRLPELVDIKTITLKSIISESGIKKIKDYISHITIRNNLNKFIPAEPAFSYDNAPNQSWLSIISSICQLLERRKIISKADAERIYQRETEGENLIVNHIAIPHCISADKKSFFAVFVRLAMPLMLNGEWVYHVLLTCTNPTATHELQIFSYLAFTLNACDKNQIMQINDHADFIELIKS